MPIYNFKVSKRESFSEKVKPANLIIFEGILSLYDKVSRNLQIKIKNFLFILLFRE